jgi:hypothetical protein
MQAVQILAEVQRRNVKLWPAGNYLEFNPASALTPELIDGLRENKDFILQTLNRREERRQDTSLAVANGTEVLEIARDVLPELEEEDRVDLDELIQANSAPEPGRDPLAKYGTDKALFFSRGGWREARPRDFKVQVKKGSTA